MTCALCELKPRTARYYEDDTVVAIDCQTCKVPLIVLKRHARQPTLAELKHIETVFDRLFAGRKWDNSAKPLGTRKPKIPDHYHVHAR